MCLQSLFDDMLIAGAVFFSAEDSAQGQGFNAPGYAVEDAVTSILEATS